MEINVLECLDKRVLFKFKSESIEKSRLREVKVTDFSVNKKCVALGDEWFITDDVEVIDFVELNKYERKTTVQRERSGLEETQQFDQEEEPEDEPEDELDLSLTTEIVSTTGPDSQLESVELSKEHLGRRILLSRRNRVNDITEGIIDEFSTSKDFIKFNGTWVDLKRHIIYDVLEEIKEEKKNKTDKMKFINDN